MSVTVRLVQYKWWFLTVSESFYPAGCTLNTTGLATTVFFFVFLWATFHTHIILVLISAMVNVTPSCAACRAELHEGGRPSSWPVERCTCHRIWVPIPLGSDKVFAPNSSSPQWLCCSFPEWNKLQHMLNTAETLKTKTLDEYKTRAVLVKRYGDS